MSCRRLAARIRCSTLCSVWLFTAAYSLSLDFNAVPAGHIKFQQFGVCLNGSPAYLGLVNPAQVTHPKKFFVEMMGGAVCFNKGSCLDSSLKRWTDLRMLMVDFLGVPQSMFDLLAGGTPVTLGQFAALNAGWIPGGFSGGHPLEGQRGLFVATCSADIGIGQQDVRYNGSWPTWYHHGGMQLRQALDTVHSIYPDLTEISMYGGSGGGVAAAAWLPKVAEIWPQAYVQGLVDSGFHLMPGTALFNWFYDNVAWSPGPGSSLAYSSYNYSVPSMNWRLVEALEQRISSFNGRVRVAYIGCSEDGIVFSDRQKMGAYVTGFNDSQVHQVAEMWNFLTTTHKCAIPGTVASWVAQCTRHHLTLWMGKMWGQGLSTATSHPYVVVSGAPSLQDFVSRFLTNQTLDASQPNKYNFWFDQRTQQMSQVVCPTTTTTTVSATMTTMAVDATTANRAFGSRTPWILLASLLWIYYACVPLPT